MAVVLYCHIPKKTKFCVFIFSWRQALRRHALRRECFSTTIKNNILGPAEATYLPINGKFRPNEVLVVTKQTSAVLLVLPHHSFSHLLRYCLST